MIYNRDDKHICLWSAIASLFTTSLSLLRDMEYVIDAEYIINNYNDILIYFILFFLLIYITFISTVASSIHLLEDSIFLEYPFRKNKKILYSDIQYAIYPLKLGFFKWRIVFKANDSIDFLSGELSKKESDEFSDLLKKKLNENNITVT